MKPYVQDIQAVVIVYVRRNVTTHMYFRSWNNTATQAVIPRIMVPSSKIQGIMPPHSHPLHTHLYVHSHMYTYTHMYTCSTHTHTRAHTCIQTHTHAHITYAHMHACMHIKQTGTPAITHQLYNAFYNTAGFAVMHSVCNVLGSCSL